MRVRVFMRDKYFLFYKKIYYTRPGRRSARMGSPLCPLIWAGTQRANSPREPLRTHTRKNRTYKVGAFREILGQNNSG